tara:strand:+ start:784 stop:2619 length:1836 start_codon:yes stop_codon:yes gene_type:complete
MNGLLISTLEASKMAAAAARITISAIDKTSKGFKSVGSGLKSITSSIFSLKTALVGVAGVAGFGYLVKSSLNSADALAKTSAKIGTTTEALSKLRYAASLTGVEANTLDMAMQRFTRRTAEAAQGTGEAKSAIAELGLDARKLQQIPLDEQMKKLAGAFGNVESDADKLRIAFKLFDSEGAALVNTLALGEEGLEAMFGRAKALGIVMSGEAAKGAENANDALSDLLFIVKGLKDQFAVALAPAITAATKTLTSFVLKLASSEKGINGVGQALAVGFLEGLSRAIKGAQEFANAVIKVANTVYGALQRFFPPEVQKQLAASIDDISARMRGMGMAAQHGIKLDTGLLGQLQEERAGLIEQLRLMEQETAEMKLIDFSGAISQIDSLKEKITALPETVTTANEKIVQSNTYTQQLQKDGAQDLSKFEAMSSADKTKNVLGNLSTQLSAQKGQSKKLFAISKAASIATAIMSTYEGATKAMAAYPPPLNFAMAAASVAGGLAQVANIRSQSFEGGGFTGHGSRTGGVDGKGGFNAILHPNESVIDHTMGGGLRSSSGGQNVIVNQTINISTGVVQTVRAEIQTLMPQIANTVKGAVADARQRGGHYSQALIGA